MSVAFSVPGPQPTQNPRPGEVWQPEDFRLRPRRIVRVEEGAGGLLKSVTHVTLDTVGIALGGPTTEAGDVWWGWAFRVKAKPQ